MRSMRVTLALAILAVSGLHAQPAAPPLAPPPAPPLLPTPVSPPPSPPRTNINSNLWPIGVLIVCMSTSAQALGANLQRYSASREQRLDAAVQRPAGKQPLFVLGVFLLIGAGIFSSIGLIFAAQSIIAPLILLLFIANPIFAYKLNGEPFNWKTDGTCTFLIISSVALVVAFAPHGDDEGDSADHIRHLLTQPTFFIFLAVTIMFIGGSYINQRRIYNRIGQDWANLSSWAEKTSAPLCVGNTYVTHAT